MITETILTAGKILKRYYKGRAMADSIADVSQEAHTSHHFEKDITDHIKHYPFCSLCIKDIEQAQEAEKNMASITTVNYGSSFPVYQSNTGLGPYLAAGQGITIGSSTPPTPAKVKEYIINIFMANGKTKTFTYKTNDGLKTISYETHGIVFNLHNAEDEMIFIPYNNILEIESHELGHRDFEPDLAKDDEKERD